MTTKVLTPVLIVLVATVLMFPSRKTMRVTIDGMNYLSTAENIAHGRGPVNITGRTELAHPFGYSLAMVPLIVAGATSQQAAWVVNWLSLIIVGLMSWLLLRDLSGLSDWRVTLGALCIMANPPLVVFSGSVLGETLGAALGLTFCWLCVRAAE